jgi:hypothetical protein
MLVYTICRVPSWWLPLWGADPRFEPGVLAFQQADALLYEPRRTLQEPRHTRTFANIILWMIVAYGCGV